MSIDEAPCQRDDTNRKHALFFRVEDRLAGKGPGACWFHAGRRWFAGPPHARGAKLKKCLLVGLAWLVITALISFAAVPRLLPPVLSLYRADIRFVVPTKEKKIFITIDDAPSESTGEILRVLKKHNVPATFFVIADCVKSPSQLDEIVAAKHSLGNHLRTFKACSKLSLPEFRADLEACSVLLERFEKPRYFRPPCGLGTQEQIAYARSRGYRAVAGTVFPLDHCISDSRWLVRLARWLSVKGGIVILHDGQTHGRTTAAVLEVLLPQLRAAGYEFGRLEEAP